jgi:hypothetical protein
VKLKSINKNPKSINDKIDNLFEKLGTPKLSTTEYKSISTLVSLKRFGDTKIGERKTFVYLKGEFNKGMLLDALE